MTSIILCFSSFQVSGKLSFFAKEVSGKLWERTRFHSMPLQLFGTLVLTFMRVFFCAHESSANNLIDSSSHACAENEFCGHKGMCSPYLFY